jgi:transcriptional regulator with XRE-family HTH domain
MEDLRDRIDAETRTYPATQVVGGNLRVLRRQHGLSLERLSDRLAEAGHPITLQVLSKIERGVRGLDVEELLLFARVFDVAPATLLVDSRAAADELLSALFEQLEQTLVARDNANIHAEYLRDEIRRHAAGLVPDVDALLAGAGLQPIDEIETIPQGPEPPDDELEERRPQPPESSTRVRVEGDDQAELGA